VAWSERLGDAIDVECGGRRGATLCFFEPGADRAGGSCGPTRGARCSSGWPRGTANGANYRLREALARLAANGGTPRFAALRSAIAVEHNCGAVVENNLENEDKRIRLDAS
jgi:hypothetical protein